MTKPQPGKSSGGSGGSGGSSSSGKPMSLKSAYLVVYNALCATGWMAVAVTLVQKLYPSVLAGPSSPRDWDFDSAANAAMPLVFVLQLCATLEILHAAFGWVKGGVLATIMQVVGRDVCLFTAACEHAVRSSPWSSALFAAWALAEIIRYVSSFVALGPGGKRRSRHL
jgi:very-long-chain (3R)-3-hydroxyacyl-CoA dehydratase